MVVEVVMEVVMEVDDAVPMLGTPSECSSQNHPRLAFPDRCGQFPARSLPRN